MRRAQPNPRSTGHRPGALRRRNTSSFGPHGGIPTPAAGRTGAPAAAGTSRGRTAGSPRTSSACAASSRPTTRTCGSTVHPLGARRLPLRLPPLSTGSSSISRPPPVGEQPRREHVRVPGDILLAVRGCARSLRPVDRPRGCERPGGGARRGGGRRVPDCASASPWLDGRRRGCCGLPGAAQGFKVSLESDGEVISITRGTLRRARTRQLPSPPSGSRRTYQRDRAQGNSR